MLSKGQVPAPRKRLDTPSLLSASHVVAITESVEIVTFGSVGSGRRWFSKGKNNLEEIMLAYRGPSEE